MSGRVISRLGKLNGGRSISRLGKIERQDGESPERMRNDEGRAFGKAEAAVYGVEVL